VGHNFVTISHYFQHIDQEAEGRCLHHNQLERNFQIEESLPEKPQIQTSGFRDRMAGKAKASSQLRTELIFHLGWLPVWPSPVLVVTRMFLGSKLGRNKIFRDRFTSSCEVAKARKTQESQSRAEISVDI
jgi:hypothetical protein